MVRVVVVAAALAAGSASPVARADPLPVDCAGDVGTLVSGSAQWQLDDLRQQLCATQGTRDSDANPVALGAGLVGGDPGYVGDPLRDPTRGWAGTRGTYASSSFVDRYGDRRDVLLFGPPGASDVPHPAVLLPCYTAWAGVKTCSWYWTAEMLAESGYVVMMADTSAKAGGTAAQPDIDTVMGLPASRDALDFMLATPAKPSPYGIDPWWARIDRSHVGCVGHSGNGAACLRDARDPRIRAVVAYDPAGGDGGNAIVPPGPNAVAAPVVLDFPSVPTMVQRADYWLTDPLTPKPVQPAPYYDPSDFTRIRAKGADEMHVVLRAATHYGWSRTFGGSTLPYSRFGEQVSSYYTLAWFDRYLRGATDPRVAADALRRLTISGPERFDSSSDRHSIGVGSYDPAKAAAAGDVAAGNVPITIGGIPVRNLLSHWFRSGYSLDRGTLVCDDLRGGCPASVPRPAAPAAARRPTPKAVTHRPAVAAATGGALAATGADGRLPVVAAVVAGLALVARRRHGAQGAEPG
jgi:hypothetical protein